MRPDARLVACLLVAAPAFAQANCYTIYDKQNRLTYQSTLVPVDLSRRISETMPARFPGGHLVMIPDESACREFRQGPLVQPRLDEVGLSSQSAPPSDQVLQASPLLRNTRPIGAGADGYSGSDIAAREAARGGTAQSSKREPAKPR